MGLGLAEAGSPRSQLLPRWPIQKGFGGVPGRLTPQQFRVNIDRFMRAAKGRRPVFWYDLGTVLGAHPSPEVAQLYNDQIWAAAGQWPNLEVLPWSTKVREDPALIRGTDIHVADAGRAVRWRLLADAVGPHFG